MWRLDSPPIINAALANHDAVPPAVCAGMCMCLHASCAGTGVHAATGCLVARPPCAQPHSGVGLQSRALAGSKKRSSPTGPHLNINDLKEVARGWGLVCGGRGHYKVRLQAQRMCARFLRNLGPAARLRETHRPSPPAELCSPEQVFHRSDAVPCTRDRDRYISKHVDSGPGERAVVS
jgi:hypothetical protein